MSPRKRLAEARRMERWGWIIGASGLLLALLAVTRTREAAGAAELQPGRRFVSPPIFAAAFGAAMTVAGVLIWRDGRRVENAALGGREGRLLRRNPARR